MISRKKWWRLANGFMENPGIEWCVLPADWKKLPFDSGSFDAIIASSVLEYLPDVEAVLAECRRTLGARGSLIATVPNTRTLTRKLERLARPLGGPAKRICRIEVVSQGAFLHQLSEILV